MLAKPGVLLAIPAGRYAQQAAELPGKIIAVTEAHLKGDFRHRIIRSPQQRRGLVHPELDQVGDG